MVAMLKTKTPTKKQTTKFILDCTKPVDDNIIDASGIEKYLHDRIKVDGKLNNLGERVQISREKAKIVIVAELPFTKRYIKYLAKKYLKKQQVRDYLRIVATNKNSYELRYFSMNPDDEMEE